MQLYLKDSIHQKHFTNQATHRVGVIFSNRRVKDLDYWPHEPTVEDEIAQTKKLFNLLQITDVRVYDNNTKA